MTPSTTRWANINGINFAFAKHCKPKFSSAHHTLNDCFARCFGRTKISHFIPSLERQDPTIAQVRHIFLIGLFRLHDTGGFSNNFFPLDMTYTDGNKRHVLDIFDSLMSLLDYASANVADGCVEIELDINPLYFKDNFNANDSREISFTSFKGCTTIQHAKALHNAMDDATERRAAEAWTFHQAATAASIRTAAIRQAKFVTNSKLVFQQASVAARIRTQIRSNEALRQAVIKSQTLHWDELPPCEPPPSEPLPPELPPWSF